MSTGLLRAMDYKKGVLVALILVIFIAACAKEPVIDKEPIKKEEEVVREKPVEEIKKEPEEGTPSLPCQDECGSFGLQECYGEGLRICGNYDSDDCLEWGFMTPCGEGYVCSGGYCVFQQQDIPPPTPSPPPSQGECSAEYTGFCEELISGENTISPNKLNLIFSGVNFDKNIVKEKALFFLFDEGLSQSTGLFTKIEPFKSNKDKFNFWLINKTSYTENEANELMRCCQLQKWYGYIFVNNVGPIERSYALFGPNASTTLYVTSSSSYAIDGALHETAHLIGGLYDEYRGGRQQEPATYAHMGDLLNKNIFYDPFLDNDNFISVQECRDNVHWKSWIGKGCGNDGSVDCIDKYVFHRTYVLRDKPLSDPSKQDLQWGTLEDVYCDYGDEENCRISLNGQLVNPFNPGEGFVSEIQINNVYRQEMFSHDILCKAEYGGTMPGMGECLNEVGCFVGGSYRDYNIYRPTFKSILAGGPYFGPYNEYLMEQEINRVLAE